MSKNKIVFLALSLIIITSFIFILFFKDSDDEIVVYNMNPNYDLSVISDFMNETNLKVSVKNFDSDADIKVGLKRVLDGDEHADLFIFGADNNIDANLLAENGLFENLQTCFDSDDSYNIKNYYTSSNLYLQPLEMYIPLFFASNENLKNEEIDLTSLSFGDELLSIVSSIIKKYSNSNDKTGLIEVDESYERIGTYMRSMGIEFYNYNDGSYNINSNEFKDTAEFGNAVYSRIYNKENYKNISLSDIKKDTNSVFIYTLTNTLQTIEKLESIYGNEFDIYPIRDDALNIHATASTFAAINHLSQNKENTYILLRKLMDKPYYENGGKMYSVNKNINNDYVKNNKKFGDKIKTILSNTIDCIIPSLNMDKTLIRCLKKYYKGEIDYNSAIEYMEKYLYNYTDFAGELPNVSGLVPDIRAYLDKTDIYKPYLYGNKNFDFVLPLRIYTPENYDSNKKYPLIVELHGNGCIGTENNSQIINSDDIILSENLTSNKEDCIIVVPQYPFFVDDSDKRISFNKQVYSLIENELIENYSIDTNRIYIAGFSMGGENVLSLIQMYLDYFAAALSAEPSEKYHEKNEKLALALKNTPLWIAFSEYDNENTNLNSTENFCSMLAEINPNFKFTKYEGNYNKTPIEFFNDKNVTNWMFSFGNKTDNDTSKNDKNNLENKTLKGPRSSLNSK